MRSPLLCLMVLPVSSAMWGQSGMPPKQATDITAAEIQAVQKNERLAEGRAANRKIALHIIRRALSQIDRRREFEIVHPIVVEEVLLICLNHGDRPVNLSFGNRSESTGHDHGLMLRGHGWLLSAVGGGGTILREQACSAKQE